jgi:hypothetical protein
MRILKIRANIGSLEMTDLIKPENLEVLQSALMNLTAGQTASISDGDFRRLSGHEITEFCSEGRLMMGNLAAASNCSIDTANGTAVFTKNQARPVAGIRSTFSKDILLEEGPRSTVHAA